MAHTFGPIDNLKVASWDQLVELLGDQEGLPFNWSGIVDENWGSDQQWDGMIIDGVTVRNISAAILFMNSLLGHGAQIRIKYTLVAETATTYTALHAAATEITSDDYEFELLYGGSQVVGIRIHVTQFYGDKDFASAIEYANQFLAQEQRTRAINSLTM